MKALLTNLKPILNKPILVWLPLAYMGLTELLIALLKTDIVHLYVEIYSLFDKAFNIPFSFFIIVGLVLPSLFYPILMIVSFLNAWTLKKSIKKYINIITTLYYIYATFEWCRPFFFLSIEG